MKNYPKLIEAKPLENYNLLLLFDNGEKRVFDFKPCLRKRYYQPLSNINLFKSVSVADGEILWTTGQDYCPHTLYETSTPIA